MKNEESWKAGKYVYIRGRLRASRDQKEVSASSRLMADLVASFYDQNIREHARGKLADLGCGKVPLYEAYKEFVTGITCVDKADTAYENPHADLIHDLNDPLPFPDHTFDTLILSDVLEHIRNPEMLLKEVFRILSPGGRVLLNVPFLYWIHEQPCDYFRYTEFALRSMAEACGFVIIKLEATGGLPEVLADLHAKLLARLPLIGKPLAISIQNLTRIFIRTSIGRRISQRSSDVFPFGYFMIMEKKP